MYLRSFIKSPNAEYLWLWKLRNGQRSWKKRMARPCPAGSSTVLFYPPNLFPPTLALLCPVQSLVCSLTTLLYRRSSSLGFVNACCYPVEKKNRDRTTEDINQLVWPWWHACSTHSRPKSYFVHPFLLPVLPWALFLVTHTLLRMLCMQYVRDRLHTQHALCRSNFYSVAYLLCIS